MGRPAPPSIGDGLTQSEKWQAALAGRLLSDCDGKRQGTSDVTAAEVNWSFKPGTCYGTIK